MENLYKILEFTTQGWVDYSETDRKLTKDQCKLRLEQLMAQGEKSKSPESSSGYVIPEFIHKAPEGYSYEILPFKRSVIAVWILHHRKFDYNLGSPVSCIWGFFDTKTKCFHSPINSKTIGNKVRIEDTTPYSAMPIKTNPLISAFI